MTLDSRLLGVYAAIFGTLGVAFGLIGFLSVQWAESVYITSASGDAVRTLGPVFAGFAALQTSVLLQFLSVVLVFVFGFVFGSRQFSPRDGALIGGAGGVVGYVSLTIPGLGLLLLAPSRAQVFPLSSILLLLVGSLVVSAVAGTAGGYVGVQTS
jgi:hypothetical protein